MGENELRNFSFEVLEIKEACQNGDAGVFIFAGYKKIFSMYWKAYFIGETNNFKKLNGHHLWNKAQKMGAISVHILVMMDGVDGQQRKLVVEQLIKSYDPIINQSEQLTQPDQKEETMSNDTEITGQLNETKAKLELLYQYEKHYLELIKEYKEEIKFANSLQEDLRRERSQFFTQTLKDVIQTMQTAEVDKTVSAQWIQELVASYTKSIDLSGDLAKTHVIEILSLLTSDTKREASEAQLDSISKKTNAK